MALNDTALNIGANAMRTAITHLSLATANPEPTGTNQATSARVAAVWGTVATGDFSLSTPAAFTGGAANGPVTHVCYWSAATGGVFYGSQALTGDTTFNSAGEYTVNTLTVNGSST